MLDARHASSAIAPRRQQQIANDFTLLLLVNGVLGGERSSVGQLMSTEIIHTGMVCSDLKLVVELTVIYDAHG